MVYRQTASGGTGREIRQPMEKRKKEEDGGEMQAAAEVQYSG
jgi:hypothetical protein